MSGANRIETKVVYLLLERCVVRFLFSEGVKPIEIHRRMRIQYGDRCMSRTQVYEWTEKFKNGVH
jgi:hypothetical protein